MQGTECIPIGSTGGKRCGVLVRYNGCKCIAKRYLGSEGFDMDYAELVGLGAIQADTQQDLANGEPTIATVRIPKNLRSAAQEAATLHGMGFSAFMGVRLIEELKKGL